MNARSIKPMTTSKITNIREILKKAKEIIDSGKSWQVTFDLIFSCDISKAFQNIVPQFDYYDPDGSYEEDVLAWYNAALAFANSLQIQEVHSISWKKAVNHENLGEVFITFDCLALQLLNPDPSSIFVEHDGDVKEVSRSMITYN